MQVDDAVTTLLDVGVTSTTVPDPVPEGVDRSLVLVQEVIDSSVRTQAPTNSVQLILGSRVPTLLELSASAAASSLTARGLAVSGIPPDAGDSAVVRSQDPALPGAFVLWDGYPLVAHDVSA
jgi:hypothetical protein